MEKLLRTHLQAEDCQTMRVIKFQLNLCHSCNFLSPHSDLPPKTKILHRKLPSPRLSHHKRCF